MIQKTCSRHTTTELEKRRIVIYTEIDYLRAELVAINREIEKRSQAQELSHNRTTTHKRFSFFRWLGL
jgi:hypothetical protein